MAVVRRRKLFYPKGAQKLGLLTKGKEWMDAETYKEYKGPYHRFTDGVVMTFGAPSQKSRYLIPYKDQSSASGVATQIYRDITTVKVDKHIAPQYHFPKVSQTDLNQGFITRYFVQKANEKSAATIIEIDKEQYEKVSKGNSKAIDGKIYQKFLLRWKLTGTEEKLKKVNFLTLKRLEQNYKGIIKYLANLSELSKYSPIITE